MSSRALYDKLGRAVVQVVVKSRAPRTYEPWDLKFQETASASACVVEGHRILTCAHAVTHAIQVHVQKAGDPRMYKAAVVALDHDRELALLSVEDPGFFDGTIPVTFGGLSHQQDEITVWGYPRGGTTLSITSGVVSRIEVVASGHARRSMLALHTDAFATYGSSGGPVFQHDRMVGVVIQGDGDSEGRIAHIVSAPVIESFFDDLADGVISGVPDLGVCWQKIENPDLAASLGLRDTESGVLVVEVVRGSSAWGRLQAGDVMTSLDGAPVAGDGTVLLRERQPVDFSAIVSRHQVGETVALDIVRQHTRLTIDVVLARRVELVGSSRSGQADRYYIHGGLVFQPLTYEYLDVWKDRIDARLVGHARYGLPTEERDEIVVLSQVLAHDVNVGYHDAVMLVVSRINGTAIRNLGDVPDAFERPTGRFHVIEVEGLGRRDAGGPHELGSRLVLDVDKARRAHAEILAQHGIGSERSRVL